MYPVSLDLPASPLYQCSSLEGLDRYFLACVRMSADIRVSVSCVVVALFGFRLINSYSVTRSVRQPARGALPYPYNMRLTAPHRI